MNGLFRWPQKQPTREERTREVFKAVTNLLKILRLRQKDNRRVPLCYLGPVIKPGLRKWVDIGFDIKSCLFYSPERPWCRYLQGLGEYCCNLLDVTAKFAMGWPGRNCKMICKSKPDYFRASAHFEPRSNGLVNSELCISRYYRSDQCVIDTGILCLNFHLGVVRKKKG